MPLQQQVFALIVSALVFIVVIDMVRTRRLREEYSLLWLVTSAIMFVLVFRYEWLTTLTTLIGAELPTTTLFLCSIIFLMLLSVQFCIKISKLTGQVKNLCQENALMKLEIENLARGYRPNLHLPEKSAESADVDLLARDTLVAEIGSK